MSEETQSVIDWADAQTIAFGDKLVSSEAFAALFKEGMSLIEETATYLDGPGRAQSRDLDRPISLVYATESMRLTTRLMQLASWLLLQRAVNEGELSKDQARTDKMKFKIAALGTSDINPAASELPSDLMELVTRSLRLQERIVHLDKLLYHTETEIDAPASNQVASDMQRLQAAFGRA